MSLRKLFDDNYNELYLRARRITQRKNVKQAPELVSETYLDVQDKEHPLNNDEFIKWFCVCMKNRYVWPNSNFNKAARLNSIDYGDFDVPDNDALNNLHLSVEETNEATKELIEVTSGMKEERVLKYIQVCEFKNALPTHERELFELHFNHELSSRKISEKLLQETGYKINYQSINIMVNSLKNKIKNTQWK